jgi:transposase
MPYREVDMFPVREIFRLWLSGLGKKQIAKRLGLDPKTVRRYLALPQTLGLPLPQGSPPSEEQLSALLAAFHSAPGRPQGQAWALCLTHKDSIQALLKEGVRLSKAQKLLARRGILIPYSTLYRFAKDCLGFGQKTPSVPVADGLPGQELELDTGLVFSLLPDSQGKRRRLKAWIFTPQLSRYLFVWPCEKESTKSAIEACEAAWQFYGGIFHVLKPDNTRAIIERADSLSPHINSLFLEYSQARGFHIDPARVRRPKDKARTERSVRFVREDCFGGEKLSTLEEAQRRALFWAEQEAGIRLHRRTQKHPKEHFEQIEKSALLPAPDEPYDLPSWSEPLVGRDHYAQVEKALYSLPGRFIGQKLRARADRTTVRFYAHHELVKVHPRKAPGEHSTDSNDLPPEKAVYARRDTEALRKEAATHGEAIEQYAELLLSGPLPWTKMRRVVALLGLCKRYGDARVEEGCRVALAGDMTDVRRLERMIQLALPPSPQETKARVIPLARYLRQKNEYALCPPKAEEQERED